MMKQVVKKRCHKRYHVCTPVKFEGIKNSNVVMADVSEGGCKVLLSEIKNVSLDKTYTLTILSNPMTSFSNINIKVKPMWIKNIGDKLELGCSVLPQVKNPLFIKYVSLIEKMTMDPIDYSQNE